MSRRNRELDDLRRSGGPAPCGFTLIEVLVVLVIVGVLAALLVPAVQSAREASRRSVCAARLRQIGQAVQSYESRFGCLPPGHGGNGESFHAAILIDIQQSALYNSINFSFNSIFVANENTTVYSGGVEMFQCPSDSGAVPGRTSYAGNWGAGVQRYGFNGAFASAGARPTTVADFTDGTSSTALASEWPTSALETPPRDPRIVVVRTAREAIRAEEFEPFVAECGGLDPRSAPLGVPTTKGTNWLIGDFGFTMYNHTLNINSNSCTNGSAFQQGCWTAGSMHPGGANVLFADGHTRFVVRGMSLNLWRAMGGRNDGKQSGQ